MAPRTVTPPRRPPPSLGGRGEGDFAAASSARSAAAAEALHFAAVCAERPSAPRGTVDCLLRSAADAEHRPPRGPPPHRPPCPAPPPPHLLRRSILRAEADEAREPRRGAADGPRHGRRRPPSPPLPAAPLRPKRAEVSQAAASAPSALSAVDSAAKAPTYSARAARGALPRLRRSVRRPPRGGGIAAAVGGRLRRPRLAPRASSPATAPLAEGYLWCGGGRSSSSALRREGARGSRSALRRGRLFRLLRRRRRGAPRRRCSATPRSAAFRVRRAEAAEGRLRGPCGEPRAAAAHCALRHEKAVARRRVGREAQLCGLFVAADRPPKVAQPRIPRFAALRPARPSSSSASTPPPRRSRRHSSAPSSARGAAQAARRRRPRGPLLRLPRAVRPLGGLCALRLFEDAAQMCAGLARSDSVAAAELLRTVAAPLAVGVARGANEAKRMYESGLSLSKHSSARSSSTSQTPRATETLRKAVGALCAYAAPLARVRADFARSSSSARGSSAAATATTPLSAAVPGDVRRRGGRRAVHSADFLIAVKIKDWR
jgi:hypothetical protein